MSLFLLLLIFLSFLFSWVLLKMIMPYLKINVVDKPNERSSHICPKPSAGGISFVVSGTIIFSLTGNFLPIICLPLALVGLIDDFINLKRTIRFSAQLFTVLLIINKSQFIGNFGELGRFFISRYFFY